VETEPAPHGEPAGEDIETYGPLPENVRNRVLALAADALGALKADDVPPALRRLARFTPGKRARLAAAPLAAALEGDPAFRQAVALQVMATLPGLGDAVAAGTVPAAADPATVAAVAYLARPPSWRAVIATAVAASQQAGAASDLEQAAEEAARLREQVREARAQVRTEGERVRAELRAAKAEIAELRHKLRDAREAARAAQSATQEALAMTEETKAGAAVAGSAAEAELRRLRSRLADVEVSLEGSRRAAREGRSMADARVRLLLDTVADAATGLRRELGLPPTTVRPADAVAALNAAERGVDDISARALPADDPTVFDDLLSLPQVHLVVDGYNVTKSGYGALPLESQRSRLVTGLGALAARSGAEVTVCFDGAALDGPVPSSGSRSVRVLFSAPGETADELIRRLVRNEPPGRPVVVVSSDREVADGVRAAGARALPASALLRRLDRA
jgi:predicted RNA-binding protein with PIN domain